MTAKAIFWSAMAVVVCILLPACLAYSVWQQLQANKRADRGSRKGAGGAGNALMELDRLVTRPSAEYTIEAETPIFKREDDAAGD